MNSSRRSLLLGGAAGAVVGAAAGAGAMLIAYPFWFPPPPAADAPIAPAGASSTTFRFRFDGKSPGRDPVHWANGSGIVARANDIWVARLEADFEAGPGPNFWIYLNTRAVGDEGEFNADAGRVKFAQLRAFKGAQNYVLPAGLDAQKFHSLTIWCETFGAFIGSGVFVRA